MIEVFEEMVIKNVSLGLGTDIRDTITCEYKNSRAMPGEGSDQFQASFIVSKL